MSTTLSNESHEKRRRVLPSRKEDPPPVFGGREAIADAIQRHDRLHRYVEMVLSAPWIADDVYGDVEEMGPAATYEFNYCLNNRVYQVANRPQFIRYTESKESRQVQSNNQRGKIEGVDYCLTDTEWLNILAEFRHRCAYCDRGSDSLQLEHLHPVILGGGTEKWNVVPACSECNGRKGGKDPAKWLGIRHLEQIRARLRRANP